jgi:hypothetical protein
VRNSAFQPMAGAYVDVFEAATADVADAFASDGTCDTAYVTNTYGITACAIDVADPDTNTDGNYTDTLTVPASTTYWAWSGAQAATFDADTTQYSMAAVATSAAPVAIELSDSLPTNAAPGLVKFGTTVTMTAQVVDVSGDPVADAGEEIWIQSQYLENAVNQGITTYKLTTDASGKATLSFTHSDPTTSAGDVDIEAWLVAYSDLPVTDDTSAPAYTWMDADSVATTLIAGAYGLDYSTGDSLVAQATVYDQYGLGLAGETVTFTDSGGDFTTADRTTNSSGVAVQPITDTTNEIDTVHAADGGLSDDVDLYFATDGTSGAIDNAALNPLPILSVDTTHSKIVGDMDGVPTVYTYDSGDFFYVGGSPESFADFVDLLDENTYATVGGTYDTSGISTFDVN